MPERCKCCKWDFGYKGITPGDTTRSWLVPQPVLLGFRLIVAIYTIILLGWSLAIQESDPVQPFGDGLPRWWGYWIYNTHWAYAALIYYFGISAIYTAYVYRRGPSSRDGNKLTHIEMYIWLSYELSWTSAWFVALSYWLVLILPLCTSPGANCTFKYPSINSHGVNVILILVETVLNKLPFWNSHVLFPMGFIVVWEIVSAIWYAAEKVWTYNVQDPNGDFGVGMAVVFWPLCIAAHVVFFFWGKLFVFLCSKCCKTKLSSKDNNSAELQDL